MKNTDSNKRIGIFFLREVSEVETLAERNFYPNNPEYRFCIFRCEQVKTRVQGDTPIKPYFFISAFLYFVNLYILSF